MRAAEPQLRAQRLLRWLEGLAEGSPLPRMAEIARRLGFPREDGAYNVCAAFTMLTRGGKIIERHGERDGGAARGHRIVRLTATGRVHCTEGCPLTLDPPDAADRDAA